MKTFYKSSELPHLWAHNLTQNARCPSAESIKGDSYYSYATAIGRRYEYKGVTCFLVNDASFSVTTSSHQSAMRGAIPSDVKVFHISAGQGCSLNYGAHKQTGVKLFEYAVEQSKECALRAEKARGKKALLLFQQDEWLLRAKEVNEFFGLRRKVDEQTIERAKAAQQRQAALKARLDVQRQAERVKADQEEITRWMNGEPIGLSYNLPCYLRANVDSHGMRSEIETSKGARITYEAGKRTFEFAVKARAKGWHKNGDQFPIDSYSLDAVNDFGIVAGCHRVDWPEIERFAKQEGWTVPA